MLEYGKLDDRAFDIINFLLLSYEKIACKHICSGELYIKIYSSRQTEEEIYNEILNEFNSNQVEIMWTVQDPPFIEDNVSALHIMITFL